MKGTKNSKYLIEVLKPHFFIGLKYENPKYCTKLSENF